MSTSTNPNSCPPCGDSPLSTAGNVIGIVQFAYLLIASAYFYYSALRHADEEFMEAMDGLRVRYDEAVSLDNRIYDILHPDEDERERSGLLTDSKAVENRLRDLHDLLEKTKLKQDEPDAEIQGSRRETIFSPIRRARFVVSKEKIRAMSKEVDESLNKLRGTYSELLSTRGLQQKEQAPGYQQDMIRNIQTGPFGGIALRDTDG